MFLVNLTKHNSIASKDLTHFGQIPAGLGNSWTYQLNRNSHIDTCEPKLDMSTIQLQSAIRQGQDK